MICPVVSGIESIRDRCCASSAAGRNMGLCSDVWSRLGVLSSVDLRLPPLFGRESRAAGNIIEQLSIALCDVGANLLCTTVL